MVCACISCHGTKNSSFREKRVAISTILHTRGKNALPSLTKDASLLQRWYQVDVRVAARWGLSLDDLDALFVFRVLRIGGWEGRDNNVARNK